MYSKKILNLLARGSIKTGDRVRVTRDGRSYEGVLMPKAEGSGDCIVLKLDNGYNVGLELKAGATLRKIASAKPSQHVKHKVHHDPSKPTVLILHTGGTIASKVDYEIGGVVARFDPEDLVGMVPELERIANIQTKLVFQEWSENMTSKHWQTLAKEVYKACRNDKIAGVVIGHGTDTMHYSAAALAFFLENLNKPVVLVGAQRSSDRGSSDAHLNLVCAAHLASQGDLAEVVIVMHESSSDDRCAIIRGVKARKMHTSRRDAFGPINGLPLGSVDRKGNLQLAGAYNKRHRGKAKLVNKFEERIALVKTYPNQSPKILEHLVKSGCKGIVLEGYALGQAYTKGPYNLLPILKKITQKIPVFMASQSIYGRVNMNVYNAGRMLQEAGVIGEMHDMHPELAFVKLGWVLGQTKDKQKVKEMMLTNCRGELGETTPYE